MTQRRSSKRASAGEALGLKLLQSVREMKAGRAARTAKVEHEARVPIATPHLLRLLVWAALICCLLLVPLAHADSWPAARIQARASENGQFVVRVVPGKSMGDVQSYGGSPKGAFAMAEWHRFDGVSYRKVHTTFLLNPIAPVDIEFTNQGVLVTLDNWHNRGIGNILVIYAPNGEVIRKYTLTDLYSLEDAKRFPTTVSSIHWRCQGVSTALESDKELVIDDSIGGRFIVKLDTGAFKYLRQGGSCR